MQTEVIKVEDLRYSYHDREALKGISFTVGRGEILGFLGPNGAGKSTTIKILTGQLSGFSGTALALGENPSSAGAAFKARIGVCFEEKNLYLNMTGRENLEFFAGLFSVPRKKVDELLEMVALEQRSRDMVSSYSKGMKQRLLVARSLLNDPDVLFLDEPTDGLDPVSARAIREIVKAQAERGTAVLLTTHDMMEADALSRRVAFLDGGLVHALDTPENFKLQYGSREIVVKTRDNGQVATETITMDRPDTGSRVRDAVQKPGLLTVHTREATLEDVFISITGRSLAD
jgi:ABC-2 type transport system ATP-binding protein